MSLPEATSPSPEQSGPESPAEPSTSAGMNAERLVVTTNGEPEPGTRLLFVVGSVLAAGVLAIAAAHAPARIRLLGLFSLGFGLLLGWGLVQFARRIGCRLGVVEFIVVGIVTLAGLVGSTWRTFSLDPANQPQASVQHPIIAAVEERMRKEGTLDPQSRLVSPPVTLTDRFCQYLARRIAALGTFSSPWPELFWSCEVLAGTVGAVWIVGRFRGPQGSPPSQPAG